MQLFYAPEIEHELCLPVEEAQHCFKVLRKNIGDTINIVDGKGSLFECRIVDNNPKKNKVDIVEIQREFGKRSGSIHLAIAPTKNMDRMEWMVEKITEIGVDEITFLYCKHSIRKNLKIERIYKKVVSAMKQSVKAYLPKINELQPFSQFIKEIESNNATKLIAHLNEGVKPIGEYSTEVDVLILIGPEGDFSVEEITQAEDAGFKSISLGHSRLRTETAGMVAVTLLQ